MLGASLVNSMSKRQHFVPVAAVRKRAGSLDGLSGVRTRYVSDLRADTDWSGALEGCDAVVHCAARAHVLKEDADEPAVAFREANVAGTLALAAQAMEIGVRKFVLVSSAGVHGVANAKPAKEDDEVSPTEEYAKSKLEAERRLVELASGSQMSVTIVRPPLIYGPRVRGNMLRLLQLALSGVPLPLGAVQNMRSFVGVTNLCEAILVCLNNEASDGRTYLVSDQSDMSTPELIRAIVAAGGKKIWLPAVPLSIVRRLAALMRLGETIDRLAVSNTVDSSAISRELGWVPPAPVEYDLMRMVHWYRE